MRGKSLMFQGTGSSVGKSMLCAAVCRILKQDGLTVAPFKAQNMALNSYATSEGLEMGRAQVTQAEAAGMSVSVDGEPYTLAETDRLYQVMEDAYYMKSYVGDQKGRITEIDFEHLNQV